MSTQRDIRPVDRVPAEPGMWVSPLNFTLPPLGDEVTPPMDPVMIIDDGGEDPAPVDPANPEAEPTLNNESKRYPYCRESVCRGWPPCTDETGHRRYHHATKQ